MPGFVKILFIIVTRGDGLKEGIVREFGIDKYTWLYPLSPRVFFLAELDGSRVSGGDQKAGAGSQFTDCEADNWNLKVGSVVS